MIHTVVRQEGAKCLVWHVIDTGTVNINYENIKSNLYDGGEITQIDHLREEEKIIRQAAMLKVPYYTTRCECE